MYSIETNQNNLSNNNNIIKKDFKKQKAIINMIISENYQLCISIIYFIIGCSFLFYSFSYVFSVYVSSNNFIFLIVQSLPFFINLFCYW